jgi:hypothetical protein
LTRAFFTGAFDVVLVTVVFFAEAFFAGAFVTFFALDGIVNSLKY